MKFLGRMPVSAYFRTSGCDLFLIHATPWDPMDEYLTRDPGAWKQRLEGIDAQFVCVGHSHIPFHLDLGSIQVINPGSVGQPRDGDWRASYAIIEDGKVSLRRSEYDLDACLDQVRRSGIDSWAVRLSEVVLRTGGVVNKEEMDAIR